MQVGQLISIDAGRIVLHSLGVVDTAQGLLGTHDCLLLQ